MSNQLEKKNQDTIKKVFKLIRPYMHYLILSLIFAAISVALTLYAPILSGNAIDLILSKGHVDFAGVFQILKKYAVVIILTGVAQWLMNLCNNKITYRVVKDVRIRAFAKLQELPLKYIDSHQYGETISRIITDVEQFSDGLLIGFSQLFTGIVTIVGTLLFMLTINVKISLVVILITPVSLFVASFIAKRTYTMFKAQSEKRAEMTSLINEMVGNQKVVQAFGYGSRALERFDEINADLQKVSLRAIFFSSITNPSTRFVNGLVYAGVGITGALSAIRGYISVGQLSCFLSYANQYTKPFNEISSVITELQNAAACARRVFDFIEETPEIPDYEQAVDLQQADGSLELKEVSFSYRKDVPLLQHLNLQVKPGQKIAIVGPTGCGKTTIINLLMRFYDIASGKISIDDKNYRDYKMSDLRKSFAMVLQDTWLFNGTVYENIAYGNENATRQQVIEAAKAAKIHRYIESLPDGYDTVLTENATNISKGQKQLLTIARAMLLDSSMLILDEATSNVDIVTEADISGAMVKLMKNKTCFVIAHRLSTIQNADRILVVKDGNIVEQGTHQELLDKKQFYYSMYNAQFS